MAAVNYFLMVEGIDGESTSAQFEGTIEIESFSWGATQSAASSGGGGSGVGKVSLSDLSVVKRVDKASPPLFLHCATGRHIPRAVLMARRNSPNVVFLQYELSDILVSSLKDAGTEGEYPLEEVTFSYGKIVYKYVPILPTGQPGQPITVAYDTRTQTAG